MINRAVYNKGNQNLLDINRLSILKVGLKYICLSLDQFSNLKADLRSSRLHD